MSKHPILVTVPEPLRGYILSAEARRRLERFADVTWNDDGHNWSGEELAARLPGQEAIIASWGLAKLTPELLAQADQLRLVAYAAGSVKGFVTDAVFERGIAVSHAASRIADSVAEYALLMAMTGLRRPHELDRRMKAGEEWPKTRDMPVYEIASARVGLLGMGYVGRRAAGLFKAVGAQVFVYDPYFPEARAQVLGVHKVELDELLSTCKVISVHLPVTQETHHMLGARELALIQDGAVFVNTARSWVVDEEALAAELARGRFWAALDVFDIEPLPLDHPFRQMDNVLLSPHVAGLTLDSQGSLMAEMIGDAERFFAGQPLQHQVTRDMLPTMA
ncbi:MAG: hydroxyacid dehydrogenase [Anaerolineae bacterium]|nr:hydroxyacid dehydrogenase [Anaerolineae bacterium]